ncbi:DNA alkylation repair protein [Paenarthrobacter aurescens]|uniref:DNA alkylation repair protein n=1 Tax=Paenarthrobacter aurescens TaxID=43663 RepID=A0A4Y3NES0_PAEAU|nr:DNA alkylation repair protein [Paenarthrobacter aurescens]MDO6143833.1 DNA alkylation repair protein [Paenarthrobacter aurescens]MDO6147680.1 DNA alkylation repair protein [Paenarthrobacter aurescens]MDO6158924.1 DNA alkylation repair protein [Paenarthrobacter aurescens]MDO6162908.1 DNA alkylation repair protein [Paenarthrobacter aurescens]GEB20360.1 DNA alkylation repair protein [Paenarthrobacter aurescens]
MTNNHLVHSIRATLVSAADAERGRGAQAYMKSEMPSLGVRVPEVRKIVKAATKQFPLTSPDELRHAVLELWRKAEVREERYAAIDLTGLKIVAEDLQMLPVYEEIIRTGAWWDLVDGVAHRILGLLLAHRSTMTPILLQWSADVDMWVRRAAITAQLGAKSKTDTGLLAAVITSNLADNEFFIRKAIGWALREYSKTDPSWVRTFVSTNGHELSPLSVREALRLLPSL